jgi:cytochrome c553
MRPLFLLASILALSCLASGKPSAAADAEPAAAPAAKDKEKVVGPPETAWKDMNDEQRATYMKKVVVPKMRPVFQEFDADEFKKFGCGTCHGKDAKARKFKMPNPEIHALPPTPAAFQAALKSKPTWPKWTKFMGEKVAPQMAGLLGKPHFDPKKPDPNAFGCAGCHTIEKS